MWQCRASEVAKRQTKHTLSVLVLLICNFFVGEEVGVCHQ